MDYFAKRKGKKNNCWGNKPFLALFFGKICGLKVH